MNIDKLSASYCLAGDGSLMIHEGVPDWIAWAALLPILVIALWFLFSRNAQSDTGPGNGYLLRDLPLVGRLIAKCDHRIEPLLVLKFIAVGAFIFIIATGLGGTPLGARNLATIATWTLWWSLVILTIPFIGTAWCAICPWDTLAGWLVRHRLWGNKGDHGGLNLTPPQWMRNVWPAAVLFLFLSWLELGTDLTTDPAATAMLSIGMLLLAVLFLAVFQRKTFCRYICPVGRTIGCYSQLSAIELRPVEQDTCERCETLECFHGNVQAEPCPTGLTMGRFAQNTYCLSCGACSVSCPDRNVSWYLRPVAREAAVNARPHWDEAWFMLVLLVLTSFHGITMIPQWQSGLEQLGLLVNASADSLLVFTIGMLLGTLPLLLPYAAGIFIISRLSNQALSFRQLFGGFAFALLPIAFTYHLAHNLGHLVREGSGLLAVFADPFGNAVLVPDPLWAHFTRGSMLLPGIVLATLQVFLLTGGYALGLHIMRQRITTLGIDGFSVRLTMICVLLVFSLFNLWLLVQPMMMRI
ncbi:MAG: 4Fe-4S binding protein [Gammaproteobacteria bacterium]|nr:4Fe-4S binding protein [Gammaproteobacteria bacterium]